MFAYQHELAALVCHFDLRVTEPRRRKQQQGIIAVEPFDYVPDGPGCAAHAIGYLRGVLEGIRS